MYTTYATDAIVCASEYTGETDARIELFTKEFGTLWGKAAGIRDERSKLRYSLQVGVYARVSLVAGSRGWRITGAEYIGRVFPHAPASVARSSRVLRLLRAVLAPEEQHEEVFTLLLRTLPILANDTDELACVASLLTLTGYIAGNTRVPHEYWVARVQENRVATLRQVNDALAANHIASHTFSTYGS